MPRDLGQDDSSERVRGMMGRASQMNIQPPTIRGGGENFAHLAKITALVEAVESFRSDSSQDKKRREMPSAPTSDRQRQIPSSTEPKLTQSFRRSMPEASADVAPQSHRKMPGQQSPSVSSPSARAPKDSDAKLIDALTSLTKEIQKLKDQMSSAEEKAGPQPDGSFAPSLGKTKQQGQTSQMASQERQERESVRRMAGSMAIAAVTRSR